MPATTGFEVVEMRGRHVPVHILHLALKYGRRAPDPQRVQGAFLYTIKMLKNGKEYALEIVVRENTGRGQWEPSSLRVPGESAEKSSMTFEFAYDVNRIASIDVDVRVLWDATKACIALRFGDDEPENGRWVAIADKVFVCVGARQTLIELRFTDVRIVTGEPS